MSTDDSARASVPRPSRLPRLTAVDRDGSRRDRPHEHAVAVVVVAYAVAVTLCVVLARMGLFALEWVVGVLSTLAVAALLVGANLLAGRAFGVFRAEPSDPFDAFAGAMGAEQIAHVRKVRSADEEAARAWLRTLGEPEVVHVDADDGTHLAAHVLLAHPGSKRWLLFAHDWHGGWQESLHHARRFAAHGYNALLPDMRAHGESGGMCVGMGPADGHDLASWAQWLVRTYGSDVRVVMMGHSMGATAVLYACGEKDLPRQVVASVEDCGYADAWNVVVPVLRGRLHLPAHPLADFLRSAMQRRLGGYDLAAIDVTPLVRRSRTPLLAIHGTADTYVGPYMAERIVQAAGGKAQGKDKRLCLVEGAGHRLSCWVDARAYYDAVFSFVGRYVR